EQRKVYINERETPRESADPFRHPFVEPRFPCLRVVVPLDRGNVAVKSGIEGCRLRRRNGRPGFIHFPAFTRLPRQEGLRRKAAAPRGFGHPQTSVSWLLILRGVRPAVPSPAARAPCRCPAFDAWDRPREAASERPSTESRSSGSPGGRTRIPKPRGGGGDGPPGGRGAGVR